MTEPRRLKHGGGAAQRLLDSASLDRAGAASRERVRAMVSTSSAFSQTTREGAPPRGALRTFATWAAVGAAASVALGFAVSSFSTASAPAPRGAVAPLAPLNGAAEIAPEELRPPIETWVDISALGHGAPDEAAALASVQAALRRKDTSAALAGLNTYEKSYPQGRLLPEAKLLRIQGLQLQGDVPQARLLADEFRTRYPQHALGVILRAHAL